MRKFCCWTNILCLSWLINISVAHAADKWGPFDLKKGDEFEYERTNSKGQISTQTKIYEGTNAAGHHVFALSSGGKETRTSFGAWISNNKYKTKTHNGVSSKTMKSGESWRHPYDILNSWNSFEYTRIRECSIVADEKVSVPAGEFKTKHVRCTSKREDRISGRDEDWWIDVRSGQIVLSKIQWTSDGHSYSSSRKLVRLKKADR